MKTNQLPVQYITAQMDSVRKALKSGCRWICWQGKDEEEAKIVVELCRKYGATCVLVDRPEWVEATQADGVHLTDISAVRSVRQQLGEQPLIGGTATTPEEIDALRKATADYVHYAVYDADNLAGTMAYLTAAEQHIYAQDYALPLCLAGEIGAEKIPALVAEGVTAIATSATDVYPSKSWWQIF